MVQTIFEILCTTPLHCGYVHNQHIYFAIRDEISTIAL